MAAYREAAPSEARDSGGARSDVHACTGSWRATASTNCGFAFERERLTARMTSVWTMSALRSLEQAIAVGSPPMRRTVAIPNGVDLERFRCPRGGRCFMPWFFMLEAFVICRTIWRLRSFARKLMPDGLEDASLMPP